MRLILVTNLKCTTSKAKCEHCHKQLVFENSCGVFFVFVFLLFFCKELSAFLVENLLRNATSQKQKRIKNLQLEWSREQCASKALQMVSGKI